MWEETLDDLELESEPRGFLFSSPFIKDKIDPIAIFFIIVSSAFILILALKFQIFHFWADFLRSNALLKMLTYPMLVSALIVVSGIIFRTILWFRYKPKTIEPGEEVNWPFVSVIISALNEEELIGKSIDSIFKNPA
jgi:hyaluronan synthase